jgi:hypothetical protein
MGFAQTLLSAPIDLRGTANRVQTDEFGAVRRAECFDFLTEALHGLDMPAV